MKNNSEYIDPDDIGLKFIFDLPNPIIITHGDVDGLCAAALLIREFKVNKIEVPIFITQPFSLKHVLKEIKNKDMKGHLIIVDLALSEKSLEQLPRGCVIIDHHPSSAEFIEELDKMGVHHLINLNLSASQICGTLVTPTKFNIYLAKMGGVGDRRIIDKRMGKQAMKVSSAMSLDPKDDAFRASIIADFVAGKKISEMKEVARKSKQAFKVLDNVKENGDILYDGENIIVKFYENGFGRASVLASKLAVATRKVAVVLTLMKGNNTQFLVTGRSPEENGKPMLDIRKFVSELMTSGEGGGLEKAASCTIKKVTLGDFIEQIETNDKAIKDRR
jgi:single-stranded DNA-specific DHH superfamily exonuclease